MRSFGRQRKNMASRTRKLNQPIGIFLDGLDALRGALTFVNIQGSRNKLSKAASAARFRKIALLHELAKSQAGLGGLRRFLNGPTRFGRDDMESRRLS